MAFQEPRPDLLHNRKSSWIDKDIVIHSPSLNTFTPLVSAFQNTVNIIRGNGRRRQNWLVFIPIIVLLMWMFPTSPPFPPTYNEEWSLERYLPQVDPRAVPPEGKNGRYLM